MTTEKVHLRRLLLEVAGLHPPPKQSPRRNESVRPPGRQSPVRRVAKSVPAATAVAEPAEEEEADTPNVAEEVAETVIAGLGGPSLVDGLPHDRSIAKILRFRMSERRLRSEGLFLSRESINPFTNLTPRDQFLLKLDANRNQHVNLLSKHILPHRSLCSP